MNEVRNNLTLNSKLDPNTLLIKNIEFDYFTAIANRFESGEFRDNNFEGITNTALIGIISTHICSSCEDSSEGFVLLNEIFALAEKQLEKNYELMDTTGSDNA